MLAAVCYGTYWFFFKPYFSPEVKIVHMIDPDSLLVKENGKLEMVQLIGVDAPELTGKAKGHQCFDSQAMKKAAEIFASGRQISLGIDGKAGERDKYGRILRYVYLSDGTFYNEKLLKDGLAKESNPNNGDYKFKNEFLLAQDSAKASKTGIWNEKSCNGRF